VISATLALGLLLTLQAKPTAPVPVPETAADVITLRDGTVVLGQMAEAPPRGLILFYVRRAWAEANVPDPAKRWESDAALELKRAYQARRDRLAAWKQERVKENAPGQEDRIARWLDQQLGRADDVEPPPAPLLVVGLRRAEIKNVVRRPKATARMLRQGWLSGFRDVESMKPAALKDALEGRGFAVGSDEPVSIDRLLPVLPETDEQWLARRGATEVSVDAGLRFIQVQNVLLPEPMPGQPLTMDMAKGMLAGLAPLLDERPVDPLSAQLREVARRGRVGAVVTQQEMSPRMDAVRITISLLVRNGQRWSKAGAKTASVRTDALKPGDGNNLAQDPQVGAVFRVFESIGFGFPPEVKQQSLNIGAATRKALGMARGAFAERLAALALPIEAEPVAK
jgi:hypothetical protein